MAEETATTEMSTCLRRSFRTLQTKTWVKCQSRGYLQTTLHHLHPNPHRRRRRRRRRLLPKTTPLRFRLFLPAPSRMTMWQSTTLHRRQPPWTFQPSPPLNPTPLPTPRRPPTLPPRMRPPRPRMRPPRPPHPPLASNSLSPCRATTLLSSARPSWSSAACSKIAPTPAPRGLVALLWRCIV